jgi:hypothetical protein
MWAAITAIALTAIGAVFSLYREWWIKDYEARRTALDDALEDARRVHEAIQRRESEDALRDWRFKVGASGARLAIRFQRESTVSKQYERLRIQLNRRLAAEGATSPPLASDSDPPLGDAAAEEGETLTEFRNFQDTAYAAMNPRPRRRTRSRGPAKADRKRAS